MKRKNFSDVAVMGGCSMDLTFYQKADGSYGATPDETAYGGKGANQAVAAARAGATVTMIANLGEDVYAEPILKNLRDNGVDVSGVKIDGDAINESSAIRVNNADKDNHIERAEGDNLAINRITPAMVREAKDAILGAKVVMSQYKAPTDALEELINLCYENHKFLVLTPCRPARLVLKDNPHNVEIFNKIGMIFCNKNECQIIFDTDDVESCVSMYPTKLVVTMGDEGLMYHNGRQVVKMPAIHTDVVDTTGAGDTLVGNFVAAYCAGLSTEDALKRAICAATLKIRKKTAQAGMPTEEETDRFMEEIKQIASYQKIIAANSIENISYFG